MAKRWKHLAAVALAATSAAVAAPGARGAEAVARVSVGLPWGASTDTGRASSVSADGRVVAFDAYTDDIVTGDNNRTWDVFARDMETGVTQRVSVSDTGAQANGPSHSPAMTPDGRFVAFWSRASNLVAADTNNAWDVFVRDREAGTTRRVSLTAAGAQGAGDREARGRLAISAEGRHVAFTSAASNLVPGDTNGQPDVFARDTVANVTRRVSVSTGGAQGTLQSENPAMSADGRLVAFQSNAANLVIGDTNGTADVFVRDLAANTTARVSVSTAGGEANAWSGEPSLSADGSRVAFHSYATSLAPGDLFQTADVFVRDLAAGTTTRVSVSPDGARAKGSSASARLSADGRVVAFFSSAANLVDDGYASVWGLYVRNLDAGTTARVALPAADGGAGFRSDLPAISADGRFVSFHSESEENGSSRHDVFLRDLSLPLAPPFTLADAGAALRIAAGLTEPTPEDWLRLNVIAASGSAATIDLQDALSIAGSLAQ